MDYEVINSMMPLLPNTKKLAKNGKVSPFRSVFPPDSIPSWITCYTGKDPSEHGVLESVNYIDKGHKRLNIDTSAFRGETFWDIIGIAGRSVCVINPFMAYPVWSVNGVMINGPVFIDGNIQIYDSGWTEGIKIPQSLGGIVGFPNRNTIGKFVKKAFVDTLEQAKFGLAVLNKNRPDLYFQTFLTMDRIQHFLWRYCDPKDPDYPGPNPYESVIEEFYILIDTILGEFLNVLEPDDRLIVISDHGHGMRCTHCFNINELLRKHGYLRSVADGKIFSKQLLVEKLKNKILNFMHKQNLADYIRKIDRFIPNAKKLKKGNHITINCHNKAYASDFSGTNPFGGVCINRTMVSDYSKTRQKVIELLDSIQVNNEPIFKWIMKREEMFNGEFLGRLPDILFCMQPQYGVNWNLHSNDIIVNPTHKLISGGHNEIGILLSNIESKKFADESEINTTNFFHTVLALNGISYGDSNNGKSFING